MLPTEIAKSQHITDQTSLDVLPGRVVEGFQNYSSARVLPQNLVPIAPMKSELPTFYSKTNVPIKRNSLPTTDFKIGGEDEVLTNIKKPKAETLSVSNLRS